MSTPIVVLDLHIGPVSKGLHTYGLMKVFVYRSCVNIAYNGDLRHSAIARLTYAGGRTSFETGRRYQSITSVVCVLTRTRRHDGLELCICTIVPFESRVFSRAAQRRQLHPDVMTTQRVVEVMRSSHALFTLHISNVIVVLKEGNVRTVPDTTEL